jgi:hypothetical protein
MQGHTSPQLLSLAGCFSPPAISSLQAANFGPGGRNRRIKTPGKTKVVAALLAGRWLGTQGHDRRRRTHAISTVLAVILSLSTLPAVPAPAQTEGGNGGAGGYGVVVDGASLNYTNSGSINGGNGGNGGDSGHGRVSWQTR